MIMQLTRHVTCIAILILAAIGCGKSHSVDKTESNSDARKSKSPAGKSAANNQKPASPKLVPVEGRIRLDGKPLAGATVKFTTENGDVSTGTTDDDGNYTLAYSDGRPGAVVGKHVVRISKNSPDGNEIVPARYNTKSLLMSAIKEGTNMMNFEL